MGSGGRHEKSRKGKHPGMSATAFALSTLVLLGAVAVAAAVVMPASPWLRLLSAAEPGAHAAGLPSRPGLVTALAMLLVSLYVFARATRNATLEVDRIRTRSLRYAWMFLFEGIWAVGFACIGEGLATHAALLSESLSLPSFTSVSGAGTCVVAAAMWVVMALAAVARCAMARHEHTGRHVACEALRAVGRSTLVALAWLAATAVPTIGGWVPLLAAWSVLVLVAGLVAVPCLAEGRHRGHSHGAGE